MCGHVHGHAHGHAHGRVHGDGYGPMSMHRRLDTVVLLGCLAELVREARQLARRFQHLCSIYSHGLSSHGLCTYGLYLMAYVVVAYIFMPYVVMADIAMAYDDLDDGYEDDDAVE